MVIKWSFMIQKCLYVFFYVWASVDALFSNSMFNFGKWHNNNNINWTEISVLMAGNFYYFKGEIKKIVQVGISVMSYYLIEFL